MKLEIFDPSETLGKGFGLWLIRIIYDQFRYELNRKKLKRWNTILQETYKVRLFNSQQIDAQTILINGMKTLVCYTAPGKITITFNKNVFVPGADRLRVMTVCKFINYGNASVSGYPVITSVLTKIQDNIQRLVDEYRRVY